MMPELMERLRLRHTLPIQSGPAQWGKPTLQLSIRLLPPLHQAVVKRKKCVVLGIKRKQDKAAADQVIIELPQYRGPRSPLDIVDVEHIFGCLLESCLEGGE
jgi:hypothetical protein